MKKPTILLCAGGTGGHLFPAQAVAHELTARGFGVHLAADERVERFAGQFPAEEIHPIRSATVSSKNPIVLAKAAIHLASGYLQARNLIRKIKPSVVAGFGGYPTVPPLLAATHLGVPTLVHEANAVLGRANRFLGPKVSKVAIGFGDTNAVDTIPVHLTGNPVRPAILAVAKQPDLERSPKDPFQLLVFGGSQGARFFSDFVPQSIALLSEQQRTNLRLVQQARPEDKSKLIEAYKEMQVEAVVDSFFDDMAGQLAKAHYVISRAGASTVSELAVIGKPALLVPYPYALDHDQANNAKAMAQSGGAIVCQQASLTPQYLAETIANAMDNPKKLALMAKNAKKTGKPNAASILADMLEELAS
ncbi:MAG: undecaprenyldiphospho-muramoylpentapeptide beta-N-acetylglucosaminyltransferase [Pseudomonadota bacterium]